MLANIAFKCDDKYSGGFAQNLNSKNRKKKQNSKLYAQIITNNKIKKIFNKSNMLI